MASFVLAGWVLCAWAGCRPAANPNQPASAEASQPLRVLVIEDVELARAMELQWTAQGGHPLAIRHAKRDEVVGDTARRLASDVVIFPSSMMGELAGRDWLSALPSELLGEPAYQRPDIWESIRLTETNWGTQSLATPLGSPALVLCYRQDIFAKLGLSPPKTWDEYQQLASRLSDPAAVGEFASDQKQWQGVCEPLGDGWAAEWLLARAAPYARHRNQFSTLFDYSTMRPLIDGAPFVRALEELVDVSKTLPAEARGLNPTSVREKFLAGNCAMAITWPSPGEATRPAAGTAPFRAGFARLPGSAAVFNYRTETWDTRLAEESPYVPLLGTSGRLAAITAECRQTTEAAALLQFISGPEISPLVAAASPHTTLFRESHLSQPEKWIDARFGQEAAEAYAQLASEVFRETTSLMTLRIPARARYMAVLDQAVRDAVDGKDKPDVLLRGAAKQWDEITDQVGRESQRQAYTRSLGLQ